MKNQLDSILTGLFILVLFTTGMSFAIAWCFGFEVTIKQALGVVLSLSALKFTIHFLKP